MGFWIFSNRARPRLLTAILTVGFAPQVSAASATARVTATVVERVGLQLTAPASGGTASAAVSGTAQSLVEVDSGGATTTSVIVRGGRTPLSFEFCAQAPGIPCTVRVVYP